jgi:small subunit ribosomal protein S9
MVIITKKVRERVNPEASQVPVTHGVGRRKKTVVARVWCYRGNGELKINGKEIDAYFHNLPTRASAMLPLTVVPHIAKHYDIRVNVQGGGLSGQADAVSLGIARAFVAAHEDVRSALKKYKLLRCDGRGKERKKPGQRAARAKFQFVKR